MFNRIKEFFTGDLENKINIILGKIDLLRFQNTEKNIITLMRHNLGSIDLEDIDKEEMTTEEKKEYLGRVSSVILPIIKKKAKKFIRIQERFMAQESDGTEGQIWFSRGSINGIKLILEDFEKENQEFIDMSKPKEVFDKHKILESIIVK